MKRIYYYLLKTTKDEIWRSEDLLNRGLIKLVQTSFKYLSAQVKLYPYNSAHTT